MRHVTSETAVVQRFGSRFSRLGGNHQIPTGIGLFTSESKNSFGIHPLKLALWCSNQARFLPLATIFQLILQRELDRCIQ